MNSICRNFYSFCKCPDPTSFISNCSSLLFFLAFLVFANTAPVYAQEAEGDGAATGLEGDVAKGESLFKSNCSSCHETGSSKSVGPGLKDVHKRHEFAWLVKWIHNSQAMVAAGDPAALKIYNEYNKIPMTSFPTFSEGDVQDILAYIESANSQTAVAAAPGAGGATGAATQAEGPSALFVVLLVVLVVVVVLLSIVLLVVLNVLSKTIAGDKAEDEPSSGPSSGGLLGRAVRHPAILSATAWVFVLLVVKTTIDGAFSVGVQQGYAPKQPIAFSHKLHAGEYEIDCNYCHTGVNRSRAATIPSANICMNCHGVVKKESPEIQKIYAAIENDQPIEWVRVHNLPDLAYFNHSQHVNVGGLECETCHGDIKTMEVVEQRSSLTMGWCIDCHRTTDVNSKGNAYYDKLVQLHQEEGKGALKVADIGGLECSKCHY